MFQAEVFQVYLFYFRVLLELSCWPRRGLSTTASNNFFGCKFNPKKTIIGCRAREQLKLRNKYRIILTIIRGSLTNQEREYILNV